jgi:hypothetical protein
MPETEVSGALPHVTNLWRGMAGRKSACYRNKNVMIAPKD